ncbi:transglycosylase domain-containing protein [Naumannella halotolerans]|nr:transglycosylase domain-containing protein [Naumannella halotolerans]
MAPASKKSLLRSRDPDRRPAAKAFGAVMFLVVSVISGVLVAGLIVPYAAIATASARAGVRAAENLPEELTVPAQGQRTTIYTADGEVLTNFYAENRVYKTLDEISPTMISAQLAIEDHRFYEHGAMDLQAFLRALFSNAAAGGVTQGGSSITQQYVKMAQIDIATRNGDEEGVARAQETSVARKVQELGYAMGLERELTKDEILERYLNIAYYGSGAYGVEAAAQTYFDKSAADLDLAESAMLAGMVQNPTATDPSNNVAAALERRDVVINRMAELGLVGSDEAQEAKDTDYNPDDISRPQNNCAAAEFPFLCDYVRETILDDQRYGETREDRENLLLRGGLQIHTQIDREAQREAEEAVASMIAAEDPAIGVMTEIQPGTGLILAMAQSRPEMGDDAGQTFYNYAVSQEMNGAEGYQMGSTFKAITTAAALESGLPPSTAYDSPSRRPFQGDTYTTCDGPATQVGEYSPANSVSAPNRVDMREGLRRSVNTYFIQLQNATGGCNVAQMADKLGLEYAPGGTLVDPAGRDYGFDHDMSMTLGVAEVTPLSVTNVYATLAARGVHCDPIIIESMQDANGDDVEIPSANCERVMSEAAADETTALLQTVMQSGGTGQPATIPGGYPQAGKTGTIDGNNAVWFAGYTPEVAGSAMIAVDKTNDYWAGRSTGLQGLTLPASGTYLAGSGGGDAGRIYSAAMAAALRDEPATNFARGPAAAGSTDDGGDEDDN